MHSKIEDLEKFVDDKSKEEQKNSDPSEVTKNLISTEKIQYYLNNHYIALLTNPNFEKKKDNSQAQSSLSPFSLSAENLESKSMQRMQDEDSDSGKSGLMEKLIVLKHEMERVSTAISELIAQRHRKVEIELKYKKIEALLKTAEENDQKISERQYFLELIDSNADSYQMLLENTKGRAADQLIAKEKQLRMLRSSATWSSMAQYAISIAASPLITFYRRFTPQSAQELVAANVPSTLDSECKSELKKLAKSCLFALKNEIENKDTIISRINTELSFGNDELKQLIVAESSDNLAVCKVDNDKAIEAMHYCRELLVTIKKNMDFLNELKAEGHVLHEFILIHNDIFVLISNFLAQFFAMFKTETAIMIDSARELQNKVAVLKDKYEKDIENQILEMKQYPDIDQGIKTQIMNQFYVEEIQEQNKNQNHIIPNKQNVRLLINSLNHLFQNTRCSEIEADEADHDIEADEQDADSNSMSTEILRSS